MPGARHAYEDLLRCSSRRRRRVYDTGRGPVRQAHSIREGGHRLGRLGGRHALPERAAAHADHARRPGQGHAGRLREYAGPGRKHVHQDPEPAEGTGPRHGRRRDDARLHGGGSGDGQQARFRRHERRLRASSSEPPSSRTNRREARFRSPRWSRRVRSSRSKCRPLGSK